MMRGVLDRLGLGYGTDKASDGHDYLKVYERYLRPLTLSTDTRPVLLELGWYEGASMRMWRDWLAPFGRIVGVDIVAKEPIPGVTFEQGDQSDPAFLAHLGAEHGPFDVIVDDASHLSPLTIASFRGLWEHVKPGGFYIVEDLQVSYHHDWHGNPKPNLPGRGGMTSMQFLRQLADHVHFGHAQAGPEIAVPYDVQHVGFYPGLCVIQKKDRP